MPITSLQVTNFRNLERVDISPCPHSLNVLIGANGSGKTSFLEAIHYLGHGRSFRTSTLAPMVRQDTEQFSIFSQIVTDNALHVNVGAERALSGHGRFKMSEKEVSGVSELANLLPIRVINSHSHQLFESGPAFRRKYIDWGLFYQNDSFFNIWRAFERALRQRNVILKEKRSRNELAAWNAEFCKYGRELDLARREYISQLRPYLRDVVSQLLPFDSIELTYDGGWDAGIDLEAVLDSSAFDEYRVGHSLYGPHRADLEVTHEGGLVKQILSRGQQKLLICAMILAQGIMLAKYVNKRLIYLIDDLPSELDVDSRRRLISMLVKQQSQVFITAIELESITGARNNDLDTDLKVFHVEHGRISEAPF